jgi:hypothetical protein
MTRMEVANAERLVCNLSLCELGSIAKGLSPGGARA